MKTIPLLFNLFLAHIFFCVSISYGQSAEEFHKSGIQKFELKEYSSAIDFFDKAIKIDPKFSVAYADRGKAKLYMEDE